MKAKLDELKLLTKSLVVRVREVDLRPQKLKELKDILNKTESFVKTAQLLFAKDDEEEKPFTKGDITALDKTLQDTYVSRSDRRTRT